MGGIKIPDELKITLAAARVNAGYTQKEVSSKIGVSRRTIVAWENGQNDIPISMAQKLCKLYRRPLDSIFFSKQSHQK